MATAAPADRRPTATWLDSRALPICASHR